MSLLEWTLTILGILAGVLLIALLYALFGQLKLILKYTDGALTVWVGMLFFRYKLYPNPKRKEKRRKKKEERKQEKETASLKRAKREPSKAEEPGVLKKTLKELAIRDYLSILHSLVTKVAAKIRCKKLKLSLSIGGEDAMQTAMEYGTVNALLYPILGAMDAAGRLKKCDVQITPDFTAEQSKAESYAVFTFQLFRAFGFLKDLIEKIH